MLIEEYIMQRYKQSNVFLFDLTRKCIAGSSRLPRSVNWLIVILESSCCRAVVTRGIVVRPLLVIGANPRYGTFIIGAIVVGAIGAGVIAIWGAIVVGAIVTPYGAFVVGAFIAGAFIVGAIIAGGTHYEPRSQKCLNLLST